jgi:HPt (histidine-containing phosphotransfer) domain-containing protein
MTNSNSKGEKLSDVLAELKGEYVQRFPAKMIKLRGLFDQQNWTDLTQEFHKLKGTGRTYGFPEVSVVCEALENICAQPQVPASLVEKCFPLFQKMQQAWAEGHLYELSGDENAQAILEGVLS